MNLAVEGQTVMSSESFWETVMRRKRLIIIIVIMLAIVTIYLQKTVVFIDVKTSATQKSQSLELTTLNNNGVRDSILQVGGIAIIPRDSVRLEAKYGSWQTSADITPLPWAGLKNISLTVDPDKNADKVSGGSLGCVTYDHVSNVLASYSCNDPSGLYVYQTPDTDGAEWKNEAYLSFPHAYNVVNYKNGLLGISNNTTPQLFYADMSTKSVSPPLIPSGMQASDLAGISIVTDEIGDSDHFLLVNAAAGTVYFATDDGKTVNYRRFATNQDKQSSARTRCILHQAKAFCYVGSSTASPDSDEDSKSYNSRSDGRLLSIDFSSDKISYSTSTISKIEPLDDIYIDNDNQLYGLSGTRLYSLNVTKAAAKRTIITGTAANVSSAARLYFISDNKLYEFDNKTKQTSLRFSSDHLRLSVINQIDNRTLINAYVEGDPSNQLHVYELNQTPNRTPGGRLIDKLPVFAGRDQSTIMSMDIHDNTIHVVLPAFVTYDSNGKFVPDERTFSNAEQEAHNYLSTLVPNLNAYHIIYARSSNSS